MDDILSNEMYYPSVCQMMLFHRADQSAKLDSFILVVNTHLIFNKYAGHIKLAMLTLILKAVLRLTQIYKVQDILFCGDFNIVPNSMLYNLLSTGKVDLDVDLREYSNQELIISNRKCGDLDYLVKLSDKKFIKRIVPPKKQINLEFLSILYYINVIIPRDGEEEIKLNGPNTFKVLDKLFLTQFYENLSNVVALRSAYAEANKKFVRKNRNKPEVSKIHYVLDPHHYNNEAFVTQYTDDMVNTVDYIWYSSSGLLKIQQILQVPSISYLKALQACCPIDCYGSDHFSLVIDFLIKD